MPQVGRPRTRTKTGAAAPLDQRSIPDTTYGMGLGISPLSGLVRPWSTFVDQHEFVPELMWPNSVKTYDQMRTDSQVAALYTAVAYGISQLRFIVDPNGAPPDMVEGISEDLNCPIRGKDDQPRRRLKHRFAHSKHVGQAMLAMIWGHMYFEQVGAIVDGMWRLRKLSPIMPHSIQYINVADDGGLVSVQQYRKANGTGLEPPPELEVDRLTAFVFQQEGPNWVGRSMLRDIYKDWLIKDRLVRVDAINHERAGGVPYVEAPPGATPGEIEDLDAMARKFRIGESAGGALPSGAKLNIARGTGSDVDKSIHSRDEAMARRFLLQLMNLAQSGQHVGSYALGETFEDFFIVGQRAIVQWYCDVMTEHVIEDWVDWNYGEDADLTPQLTWERTSEDALGVEQLALLTQRGVIIVDEELEDAIRYKYRLPKRTSPRPEEVVGPGVPRQPPETPPGEQTPKGADGSQRQQAPSSSPSAPAPVKASAVFDWERDISLGHPHVMAAAPSLVTVPNIAILEAGVEYKISTGTTTFTPEDLSSAVMAANEDPSIPTPRLKLGHIDPRFNGPEFDATPNFGMAKNLRLNDNGTVVFADYVGVPKWLAEIMPTAFPSRSVEGFWDIESFAGKKWPFVLSACSMLGVQWPGITQLPDLPQYYGDKIPDSVVIAPELAASLPGGGNMETQASASLDDVRRAFYSDYIPNNQDVRFCWIRAVLTDPNQLVIEDDESGQLHLLPFNSDAEGSVSFGDPEAVRVEYVTDLKAAASHVAAALAIGRKVLATYDSRAASSPNQGGGMDPKEVRQRLNLPEDASDEQVQAKVRENNEVAEALKGSGEEKPAEEKPAVEEKPAAEEKPAEEKPAPAEEQPVQEAVAASAASGAEVVQIDKGTLDQLRRGSQAGLDLKKEQEKKDREAAVAAAIGDGRIPPARKEHWLKHLEADPEGGTTVLASLAPGLIPVDERNTNQSAETMASDEAEAIEGWTHVLFPETRRRKEALAQVAASGKQPLISREEGL